MTIWLPSKSLQLITHQLPYHSTLHTLRPWRHLSRNIIRPIKLASQKRNKKCFTRFYKLCTSIPTPEPNTMPNIAVKWQQHYPVLIDHILVLKLYIITAFSRYSSMPPHICWDNNSNLTMTTFLHILTSSFFH